MGKSLGVAVPAAVVRMQIRVPLALILRLNCLFSAISGAEIVTRRPADSIRLKTRLSSSNSRPLRQITSTEIGTNPQG